MSLSLADNSIGKTGGMSFAETLQLNITLEHLNLSHCDLVSDEGMSRTRRDGMSVVH